MWFLSLLIDIDDTKKMINGKFTNFISYLNFFTAKMLAQTELSRIMRKPQHEKIFESHQILFFYLDSFVLNSHINSVE